MSFREANDWFRCIERTVGKWGLSSWFKTRTGVWDDQSNRHWNSWYIWKKLNLFKRQGSEFEEFKSWELKIG